MVRLWVVSCHEIDRVARGPRWALCISRGNWSFECLCERAPRVGSSFNLGPKGVPSVWLIQVINEILYQRGYS
jgi:hypothetical protein